MFNYFRRQRVRSREQVVGEATGGNIVGSELRGHLRPLLELLSTVDVVVDCGASDGSWTRLVGDYFPNSRLVVGVEPLVEFQLPSNVTAVRCVVASECGERSLGVTSDLFSSSVVYEGTSQRKVEAHTLACILQSVEVRPDDRVFVKTDLQGFDVDAIKSAGPFLDQIVAVQCELQVRRFSPAMKSLAESVRELSAVGLEVVAIFDRMNAPSDGLLGQVDVLALRSDSASIRAATW